ncbi:META domain-containing protein [Streptomyces sp. NPDC059816]|uniref:META domain-containing protein n=1 Tax=Streptomyces sp. NPDC059816 TaxID=3346960 RepID=UPI00365E440B
MRRRTPLTATALACLLAVAGTACGNQVNSGDGDGDRGGDGDGGAGSAGRAKGADRADATHGTGPLSGTRWTVRSLTAGGREYRPPTGAHLAFEGKSRASGSYGCNTFDADVTVTGRNVTFREQESTTRGCDPAVSDFEDRLAATLRAGALEFARKGDALTLTTAKGDHVDLAAGKTPRDVPLTGTKWVVNTLVEGGSSISVPGGAASAAHLTFGKGGEVSGTLGCNRFSAEAKIGDDGTLTLSDPAMTRMVCDDRAMRTERALSRLFGGAKVDYEVNGNSLRLIAPDGRGAVATAAPAVPPTDGATGRTGR